MPLRGKWFFLYKQVNSALAGTGMVVGLYKQMVGRKSNGVSTTYVYLQRNSLTM